MNVIDLSIDQDWTEITHGGTQLQPASEKQKGHISLAYTVSPDQPQPHRESLSQEEKLKE